MRIFNRGGIPTWLGIAASILFAGCQSTQAPQENKENEVSEEVVQAPVPDFSNEAPLGEAEDQADSAIQDEHVAEVERGRPIRGRNPRALEELSKRLQAELLRDEEERTWTLNAQGRSLQLKEGSRVAVLDGVKVYLDEPLAKKGGDWSVGSSDLRVILDSVFSAGKGNRPVNTVVIDPGHGGSQDGTKNESLGILEKEMTLDVSLRLMEHLQESGFKVVLTRYDDRLMGLDDRAKLANGVGADLFVSVHFNAALNAEAQGLETYMLTPAGHPSSSSDESVGQALAYPGNQFDVENFELAHRIQSSLIEKLERADRGVKKARFRVLKSLESPGVLAECGFVSNQNEGLLISTAGYRERVAQALAEAIAAYAGKRSGDS